MTLEEQWKIYKQIELDAQTARRKIEDEIALELAKPADFVGRANVGDLEVSYTMSESLDRETLLASGIDHDTLKIFVRWKPELNRAAYKTAPANVRAAIEKAITRKPGRPSFSAKETKGE